MSYLVLARKWRPKNFDEVVGQDHVVRTLKHALDQNRLHHAYLFTGTRGVGKTTLARILAKALNCEKGVSSNPCNQCDICTEIDEGRFIDLIEVDAASRTKVEDTRALLENVPYRSSSGRYKIYLIDEIHMLSGHSFNALLKTLEEPPEHVKFLMATTDPQKLPVTVLSRCIQFNLRAMDIEEISGQIEKILKKENLKFELGAISDIARLSNGSMRDGLSILDQAISYTQGNLKESLLRDMLGMISNESLSNLLIAIAKRDIKQAMAVVELMCERAVNFATTLDDLLLKFYELALYKQSPSILREKDRDVEVLEALDSLLSEEEVQLLYQIGLIGKRDLALAPDPRSGFEMLIIRLMAFLPESATQASGTSGGNNVKSKKRVADTESIPIFQQKQAKSTPPAPKVKERNSKRDNKVEKVQYKPIHSSDDWLEFVEKSEKLGLVRGIEGIIVSKLKFQNREGNKITFTLPKEEESSILLRNGKFRTVLEGILESTYGEKILIAVRYDDSNQNESLEIRSKRIQKNEITRMRKEIESEQIPMRLINEFGAQLDITSIRPAGDSSN